MENIFNYNPENNDEKAVCDFLKKCLSGNVAKRNVLKMLIEEYPSFDDDAYLLAEKLLMEYPESGTGDSGIVLNDFRYFKHNGFCFNFHSSVRSQFTQEDGSLDILLSVGRDSNIESPHFEYNLQVDTSLSGLRYEKTVSPYTEYSGLMFATMLDKDFLKEQLYAPYVVFYPVLNDTLNGFSYRLDRFEYLVVPSNFESFFTVDTLYMYCLGTPDKPVANMDTGDLYSLGLKMVMNSSLRYLESAGLEHIEMVVSIVDSEDNLVARRNIRLSARGKGRFEFSGALLGDGPSRGILSYVRLKPGERYTIYLNVWDKPIAWKSFVAEAENNSFDNMDDDTFHFEEMLGRKVKPDGNPTSMHHLAFCLSDVNKVRAAKGMPPVFKYETDEEVEFEDLLASMEFCVRRKKEDIEVLSFSFYKDEKSIDSDLPLSSMINCSSREDLFAKVKYKADDEICAETVTVKAVNRRIKLGIECEKTGNGPLDKDGTGSFCFKVPIQMVFPESDIRPIEELVIEIHSDFTGKLLFFEKFKMITTDDMSDIIRIKKMVFEPAGESVHPSAINPNNSLIAFRQKSLRKMLVACYFDTERDFNVDSLSPSFSIHDASGRLLEKIDVCGVDVSDGTRMLACGFGEFCRYDWPKGSYRIELSMADSILASCSVEVGNNELEGEYDPTRAAVQVYDASGSKKSAKKELDSLIGLASVKEQIASFSSLALMSVRRKEAGFPATLPALHSVFMGNPGTGKTTVAKIMGRIYHEMGLLSSGHVVMAERKNLVGRYYDSELRAVEDAVRRAKGGVLFIDEAYTLCVEEDPKDPGHKIIETLLNFLSGESSRDFMLVLAGYRDRMTQMLISNPGLSSRIPNEFIFEDYSIDELEKIAQRYCRINKYIMTPGAFSRLKAIIARDYAAKDDNFGNARYVVNLIEKQVLTRMSKRVGQLSDSTKEDLVNILDEDVPMVETADDPGGSMAELNGMVGLHDLKQNIFSHLNFVKMMNMRVKAGLNTSIPPLHMIFTGNPGTGKTTVADLMGEIYASMGLLSRGEVVKVEKKDLVGSYPGETEKKMRSVLNQARGNILFIDEAYQLYEDSTGYGRDVINSLLTTLSRDGLDMIVILAGYTEDMERMLDMNEGLRSRFPYRFHFNDYTVDELVEIGLRRVARENFIFSPKALERFRALVMKEARNRKSSFGNGRFVTRLISSKILPAMGSRIAGMDSQPTEKQLQTILASDIPISSEEADRILKGAFDDDAIDSALSKLDSMVGLDNVKAVIHNFVKLCRYRNSIGEPLLDKGLLKWSFLGNTGTGKSTVAGILAEILKAMNLIQSSRVEEIKGEMIFNVPEQKCDNVLGTAMMRSRYGMLFIDGDAPEFKSSGYSLTSEQLRFKLSSLTAETGGPGAMVIAEVASPRKQAALELYGNSLIYGGTLVFGDYSEDELFRILLKCLSRYKVKFSTEAEHKIREYISGLCSCRELAFANARTMKNLSDAIYERVQLRKADGKGCPKRTIEIEDVADFDYIHRFRAGKIGY